MSTESQRQPALAVLIDAENASPAIVEGLLAEVAKFGVAYVKRIYADWTGPQHAGWKAALVEHAIQPVQQFAYTTGKNSTDSALIIDAMDLLHTGHVDGFCLVSSDSDFTRLASRLREAGKRVYGFGEHKTPRSLVSACDKFVYTEVLAAESGAPSPLAPRTQKTLRSDKRLAALFASAIEAASDEEGWANLGQVGTNIIKQAPEFDPRNYGFTKLVELVTAMGTYEVSRAHQVVRIRATSPAPTTRKRGRTRSAPL